ncbi:chloramphenicol acetyltransferase [Clostridium senegalense]|uniref:Chloramphenicol acetyltransferase n=1 Tax=Clostridium senegalense TaxID=1465809 RepID=A0A6M0H3V8_9CLOT|nr:chloramphenicol acetyltransferase [Clostridium senegalense]NEU04904.1 chloramphenicol acetyltransferase [Clostridium senegalense]
MKELNIDQWKRKKQYEHFKNLDYPHISVCANIDITNFYNYIKTKRRPFFISFVYVVTKTANLINEFKYRVRDEKVIVHDVVSPSFTIMNDDEVFNFCPVEFSEDFNEFVSKGTNEINRRKKFVDLKDEPNRDDFLFITSIPWVSFTSMSHPIHMSPVDTIPRIAWGKYFKENEKIKMPLSIQAHHALVDGVHIGMYFEKIQQILNNPEIYL